MTVERSWARITSWLEQNAPATAAKIRRAAPESARAASEASFPTAWPADLRDWYALQDGESMQKLWRCVLPHWEILSVVDVVSQAETWLGFADHAAGEDDEGIDAPSPDAGQSVLAFLPDFVPIAGDGCGNTLFVDLRPGSEHGCVSEFEAEDGMSGPTWPSVTRMLEDLADSLESGRECDGWLPSVEEGELSWDLADAD
jgi:cell wall assembly regulator SMI1